MKTILSILVAAAAVLPIYGASPQPLALTRQSAAMERIVPLPAGKPEIPIRAHSTVKAVKTDGIAADDYIYTIVEEDFSGFSEGSQEELGTDYIGVAGMPYIDDALTHQPGWSTLYGVQADGAIAINSPIGGCLNTPQGDYAGKITIEFRMRIPSGFGTVGVMIANNGIWTPDILDARMVVVDPEETEDPSEWHTYKMEFDNAYSNDDCFVQFCAYYCQVIIDDIRIISDLSASIDSPKAKGATAFTRDGFTAAWSEVRSADHYYLNVFREIETGDPWCRTEDFSAGIPYEWTAEGGVESVVKGGLDDSPCIAVSDNAVVTTPLFEERLRSVDIWFRLIEGESYASSINVQGFDGANWNDMGQLFLEIIPSDPDGAHLVISGKSNPVHHDRYYQLRFVFKGFEQDKEYGMSPVVVLDDITIESMPKMERDYAITDMPVEGGSYVCHGLDPESDYFYYVRVTRADGKKATGSPALAFGISCPENPSVGAVTSDSYTATWEYTPKATAYYVRDFGVFEADSPETDYPVLYETFSPASEFGGTLDQPLMCDNKYSWVYLDPYTDNAGWTGASTILAEGCVGTGGGGMMGIRSPELSLGNGDRSFSVRCMLYSYGDDGILITPSSAKAEYIGFEVAEGWNEVSLDYMDGSPDEVLAFSAQNSTPFMLGEVEVCQSLNPGEKVYRFLRSDNIAGGGNVSHTFDDVDFTAFPNHAFDVRAIYEKEYIECASEISDRISISSANDGLTVARYLGKAIVRPGKGGVDITLGEPMELTFFHIDGRVGKIVKAASGHTFIGLESGLWIVRAGNESYRLTIN